VPRGVGCWHRGELVPTEGDRAELPPSSPGRSGTGMAVGRVAAACGRRGTAREDPGSARPWLRAPRLRPVPLRREDSRREGCPQTGVSALAFTQFWVKRRTFTQCVSPVSALAFPGGHARRGPRWEGGSGHQCPDGVSEKETVSPKPPPKPCHLRRDQRVTRLRGL